MTPSNRDAVQFTRESAERIASVVRAAELAPATGRPLSFDAIPPSAAKSKVLRVGTFAAPWDKDTSKTVTFYGVTTTPNTVTAQNLLFDVPPPAAGGDATRVCIIGKDGTAWQFINVERDQCDDGGMSVDEIRPFDKTSPFLLGDRIFMARPEQKCPHWLEPIELEVVTGIGFSDGIIQFTKRPVIVLSAGEGNTFPVDIPTTECPDEE